MLVLLIYFINEAKPEKISIEGPACQVYGGDKITLSCSVGPSFPGLEIQNHEKIFIRSEKSFHIFSIIETKIKWLVENEEIKNARTSLKRYLPDTNDQRFITTSELDAKVL